MAENVIDIVSEVMNRREPMDFLEGVAWMEEEDRIGIVINTGMGETGTGRGSAGMEKCYEIGFVEGVGLVRQLGMATGNNNAIQFIYY